jgi:antirestriction protein
MLKIYLTDLAAYNKGYLFGEWVSLPSDNINKTLAKILRAGEAMCFIEESYFEKHEEYFITDYEWEDIELFKICEYENIFSLNETLFRLEQLNQSELKAIRFLLSEQIASNLKDAITKVDNVTIYENQAISDVAYELLNECYDLDKLPNIITSHIDYDGIARDLELDRNYTVIENDVYEYHG